MARECWTRDFCSVRLVLNWGAWFIGASFSAGIRTSWRGGWAVFIAWTAVIYPNNQGKHPNYLVDAVFSSGGQMLVHPGARKD